MLATKAHEQRLSFLVYWIEKSAVAMITTEQSYVPFCSNFSPAVASHTKIEQPASYYVSGGLSPTLKIEMHTVKIWLENSLHTATIKNCCVKYVYSPQEWKPWYGYGGDWTCSVMSKQRRLGDIGFACQTPPIFENWTDCCTRMKESNKINEKRLQCSRGGRAWTRW